MRCITFDLFFNAKFGDTCASIDTHNPVDPHTHRSTNVKTQTLPVGPHTIKPVDPRTGNAVGPHARIPTTHPHTSKSEDPHNGVSTQRYTHTSTYQ
jgi:hypothetical protein